MLSEAPTSLEGPVLRRSILGFCGICRFQAKNFFRRLQGRFYRFSYVIFAQVVPRTLETQGTVSIVATWDLAACVLASCLCDRGRMGRKPGAWPKCRRCRRSVFQFAGCQCQGCDRCASFKAFHDATQAAETRGIWTLGPYYLRTVTSDIILESTIFSC